MVVYIPGEAAETLKAAFGSNLDRVALEGLAIEGYRRRKFGVGQVRRLLGFGTRWEAEQWLGGRGVTWNYSIEDLDADAKRIAELLGNA